MSSATSGVQGGGELLFDVISTAYERTSMIVTTKPAIRVVDRGPRFGAPHRGDASTGSPTGAGSSRPKERATGSPMLSPELAGPSRTQTVDEPQAAR